MNEEELSFEDALTKIGGIVNELEQGNLSLGDSVAKFKEGLKLSEDCSKKLEETELIIKKIIEKEEGIVFENFK